MDAATLESKRFARRVSRFGFERLDRDALDAIERATPDLAIIRVDSSHIDQVQVLSQLGATPIVADTLVYYDGLVGDLTGRSADGDQRVVRRASGSERAVLEEMIATTFVGYKNHYSANPLIDRGDILAGYTQWGLSFLEPGAGDLWFAEEDGEVAGFAACTAADGVYRIILNGVRPPFAGRGIYSDLVGHIIDHASATGLDRVEVSTQIDNLAVQRVWANHGMRLCTALNTVHLNLFLSDDHLGEQHSSTVVEALPDGQQSARLLIEGLIERDLALLAPELDGTVAARSAIHRQAVEVGDRLDIRVLIKHHDAQTQCTTIATRVHNQAGELVQRGNIVISPPSKDHS